MMDVMDGAKLNRTMGAFGVVLGVVVALLTWGPSAGVAHAAGAAPAGDAISIGDLDAPGQIDLYVDPLCAPCGTMIRTQGDEIGRRIEGGKLHVNLRFVDSLDKYSASGFYDNRAIYAAYAVAGMSQSSDVTWRFVQQIFSAEHQPAENGPTDLSNDQLADLAGRVGAPQTAQGLIRFGLAIGYDARAIASNNDAALRKFPKPTVPLVVINGQPVDGLSGWLGQLPG